MRATMIVIAAMSSGCLAGMHGALQESSVVGAVPCTKKQMEIDLDEFENGSTGWLWIAKCNGVRYSCARTFTGGAFMGGVSSETRCTALEPPPTRSTDRIPPHHPKPTPTPATATSTVPTAAPRAPL